MKRGMTSLSSAEAKIAEQILESSGDDFELVNLKQKLSTIVKDIENLELSEDETERLIDQLPIPQKSEPLALTELRMKLVSFLTKLRL